MVLLSGVSHDQLGYPLRCPIDAGGLDRFIGRDMHQALDTCDDRSVDHALCPKYIICSRLFDINLHKRNMLMRRGVKYDFGMIICEHLTNAVNVTDIRNYGLRIHIRKIFL